MSLVDFPCFCGPLVTARSQIVVLVITWLLPSYYLAIAWLLAGKAAADCVRN